MKSLFTFLFLFALHSVSGQSFLFKNICPGGCGANPNHLTAINGALYFSANNGQKGQELWRSDGTPLGTALVKDIHPGAAGSSPAQFTANNGKVFFVADDGTHGQELWLTDGTGLNTALVKDIYPGSASSSISQLTSVGGILYFLANDGVHGIELWKSNGTAAGTVLLRDFKSGVADGGIQSMAAFQGSLLFSRTFIAADGYTVDSGQLWKYDVNINAFSVLFTVNGQYMNHLTAHLGSLYYGQGDAGEFIDVYRLNADQKGGSWFYTVASYFTTWLKSEGDKLFVASADESLPLVVRGVDQNGHQTNNLGDGVTDVAAAGGSVFFAAKDENNALPDAYSVFKDKPYVSPLASFKGQVNEVEALGTQVFFTAYTSVNGAELRSVKVTSASREGVGELVVNNSLKVYPNPASSQATVAFLASGWTSVALYDSQGKKVQSLFEGEVNSGEVKEVVVNTSTAVNGLYFVRVGNQYSKLIIEK